MLKCGDCIEIVSTGKPQEVQVNVNGVNVADQVSGVRIDLDPVSTKVTLVCEGLTPVVVRGYLVPEVDMRAFQEWRAERVIADVARQPERTREMIDSMAGITPKQAITNFVVSLKTT